MIKSIKVLYDADGDLTLQISVFKRFKSKAMELVSNIEQWLLNGKEIDLKAEEHKEKRSLTANGFFWHLVEELSKASGESEGEIYLNMLTNYGETQIDENGEKMMFSILSNISPNSVKKEFKHIAIMGESETNGKMFTHYRVLKGSSEFNSKQMARLIDGIVQECEQYNQECGQNKIDTLIPEKRALLCEKWGQKC